MEVREPLRPDEPLRDDELPEEEEPAPTKSPFPLPANPEKSIFKESIDRMPDAPELVELELFRLELFELFELLEVLELLFEEELDDGLIAVSVPYPLLDELPDCAETVSQSKTTNKNGQTIEKMKSRTIITVFEICMRKQPFLKNIIISPSNLNHIKIDRLR